MEDFITSSATKHDATSSFTPLSTLLPRRVSPAADSNGNSHRSNTVMPCLVMTLLYSLKAPRQKDGHLTPPLCLAPLIAAAYFSTFLAVPSL
ncbi:MAG: hypothetical protein II122_05060 [Bacteroidaceae bacterium]|nr:hypothetical protein [Bacteroidaceae bacterium]